MLSLVEESDEVDDDPQAEAMSVLPPAVLA
jgi:hypothetical protein